MSKALVVPALKRHTATVIVAHGLGDSGVGWVWLAENWRMRNKFEEVSFIFPSAPNIPITLNMGMRMPGWYDIASLDELKRAEDETGINRSRAYFHELINAEIKKGIPSNRIVLGGFSQGGAMSLLSGLTSPHKLGGIFGLSCYLLLKDKAQAMIADANNANKETKIFIGHGDEDQVVKHAAGKTSAEVLKQWGYDVDFRTYAGLVHSADPEEIDDLESYLNDRIPPLGASGSL
ncbi:acyl-protein thioesteras-like protein 1 [Eremomyces bilateralis CBS 781.70]|uniref:Acyl-protein thioesterase 1 n=1 Tax=Eremomyces bilateralis CBS 781.70 TaxID=1392243 RepID=A0A6G1G3A9_9PEZI|nr:acyl-protein thioesteras-like protein 1 [Eremomyces bilateralis CBS 781.70]KAF1812597.1 acyl-protein thioesteras-like protein 1 [Eremomyces bilateralis CBS 781.70]